MYGDYMDIVEGVLVGKQGDVKLGEPVQKPFAAAWGKRAVPDHDDFIEIGGDSFHREARYWDLTPLFGTQPGSAARWKAIQVVKRRGPIDFPLPPRPQIEPRDVLYPAALCALVYAAAQVWRIVNEFLQA